MQICICIYRWIDNRTILGNRHELGEENPELNKIKVQIYQAENIPEYWKIVLFTNQLVHLLGKKSGF